MTNEQSEALNEQLNIIHEQLMDLLDVAQTEVMWVDGMRGLLVFAKNTDDPEQLNMIKPLKAALGMGETRQ
jgi:hypothetical protein